MSVALATSLSLSLGFASAIRNPAGCPLLCVDTHAGLGGVTGLSIEELGLAGVVIYEILCRSRSPENRSTRTRGVWTGSLSLFLPLLYIKQEVPSREGTCRVTHCARASYRLVVLLFELLELVHEFERPTA